LSTVCANCHKSRGMSKALTKKFSIGLQYRPLGWKNADIS
jgi:hypothetical protein